MNKKLNSRSPIALIVLFALIACCGCQSSEDPVVVNGDAGATNDTAATLPEKDGNVVAAVAEGDVVKSGGASDVRTTGAPDVAAAGATAKAGDATKDEEPPKIYVRPRTKIRAGGVLDLVFDDLAFDIEADADFKREMLTNEIESYDGKSIILRGFMLDASVFKNTGIEEFVLIRDTQECCFGPGAKVCHNIWVNMDKGKSAKFHRRPMEVRGKFTIRPYIHPADGKCYSVYHLQAESAVIAR